MHKSYSCSSSLPAVGSVRFKKSYFNDSDRCVGISHDLIYIFLITFEVGHLFVLFAIQISCLVMYLFKSFTYFKSWVVCFLVVVFLTC